MLLHTGTPTAQLKLSTITDFAPGRPFRLDWIVDLLPADLAAGVTITDAILRIAPEFGDPVVITKHITPSTNGGLGSITDNCATDGRGALYIELTANDTTLLAAKHAYELTAIDSLGRESAIDHGAIFATEEYLGQPGDVITVTITGALPVTGAPGATFQLVAAAYDLSGNPVPGVLFTWASDNPAIASVSNSGLVTLHAPGNASISATAATPTGVVVGTTGAACVSGASEGDVLTYDSATGTWVAAPIAVGSGMPDGDIGDLMQYMPSPGKGKKGTKQGGAWTPTPKVAFAGAPFYDAMHPTFGAKADGSHDDRLALFNTNAAVGTKGVLQLLPGAGSYVVGSNLTIDCAMLRPVAGAKIKPLTGATVTFLCAIDESAQDFLDYSGGGAFSFAGNVRQRDFHVRWFGAFAQSSNESTALNHAIDACYGPLANRNGTNKWGQNRRLLFGPGEYQCQAALKLCVLDGFHIEGVSRLATTITMTTPNTLLFDMDAVAYGMIEKLTLKAGAAQDYDHALCEVDWSGLYQSTLKPQQITFNFVDFVGNNLAAVGCRIAKHGASASDGAGNNNQGTQGDTFIFLNCGWFGCTRAGLGIGCTLYSPAQNALGILVQGGDVQGCLWNGIEILGGQVMIDGTSFQNQGSFGTSEVIRQVEQLGGDVTIYMACVSPPVLRNLRSESLVLLAGNGSATVEDCQTFGGSVHQRPNAQPVTQGQLYFGQQGQPTADGRAWICHTAGVTGSSEPPWNTQAAATWSRPENNRGCTMNAGSNRVSCPGGFLFVAAPEGFGIMVSGAGPGGAPLFGFAHWVGDGTNIDVRDVNGNPLNASTSVTNTQVRVGQLVIDGAAKFLHYEFTACANSGSVKRSKFQFGRVRSTGYLDTIEDCVFSRHDWFDFDSIVGYFGGAFQASQWTGRLNVRNPMVGQGSIGIPPAPGAQHSWTPNAPGDYPAPAYDVTQKPLLWKQGAGGLYFDPVGLDRVAGAQGGGPNGNALGVVGRHLSGAPWPNSPSGPSGADVPGLDTRLSSVPGTGVGAPGRLVLSSPVKGASGNTATQALADTLTLDQGHAIIAAPTTAPADAALPNGSASTYLDEASGQLVQRVRKSDGSYTTAPVPLGSWPVSLLPVVADAHDRAGQYPSPADGARVHNTAAQEIQEYSASLGRWFTSIERPSETVNPRKFALETWYTATGVSTIGQNREDYLTPTDLATITAIGARGQYYAYVDTRDFYCLMEAILEAWAPGSVAGNIQFGSGRNRTLYIPPGDYLINRPIWSSQILGAHMVGHSPSSSRIRGFMPGSRVYWTDGMTSCSIRRVGFDHVSLRNENSYNNFWQPILDNDWFSQFGAVGGVPPSVAYDGTARHVTGFASPSLKRQGSGWTPNQFAGKWLIVIDDTNNYVCVGQAIRIRENSTDTLYLDGRWSWVPSGVGTKFIIAPKKYGWARWHGNNWMTDYDPKTDFSATGANVVAGDTLYRFHNGNKYDGLNAPQLLQVTVGSVSATKKTLVLTADWSTWAGSQAPYPSTRDQPMEANAQAEIPAPYHDLCNYCVGGTYFDNNGGANPITGNNDTYIDLDSSPGAIHHTVGGYCQFSASGTAYNGVVSSSDSINIVQNGVDRRVVSGNPNTDSLKYLMATSGPGLGARRLIKSMTVAGGNTTWVLNDALGMNAGDSFAIVDASVIGMILPIADQPTLTRLQFNYEIGGGIRQRYLFSKNPSIGDTITILAANRGVAFTHNYFEQVEPQASDGKSELLWAWARSGDGSMGSEATIIDCTCNAPRTGFYVAGLNAINIYWRGGQAGAPQHTFYVEKGWINIKGTGFGGGTPYTMQKKGMDVSVNTSSANRRTRFSELDSETGLLIDCSQPCLIDDCAVAAGIGGQRLNAGHVWSEGDLWYPVQSFGRQYMCVAVFGTRLTDAVVESTLNMDSLLIGAVDGSGNGAHFVRMDPFAISTAQPDSVLIGGNYAGGVFNAQGGPSVIGGEWSRPDWFFGNGTLRNVQLGTGTHIANVKVVPGIFDGSYAGQPCLPYHLFFRFNVLNNVNRFQHPTPMMHAGPIIMVVGDNGTPWQTGFNPYSPNQCDGATVLLAVLEQGSPAIPQGPVVLGKPPASGVDQPGREFLLAGGMATGAGIGGPVRVQAGARGGASGNAVRGLVDAAQFDNDVGAGNTRFLLYDVTAGTLKRVTVGAADSGGSGFKVLRVVN